MDNNLQSLGLENNLTATSSLMNKFPTVNSIDFDSLYEVQGANVNVSKANLAEFVKITESGSARGTFNQTTALFITTTVVYVTPHADLRTFGKPILGIYQGTSNAAADEIYPITGTNVTLGRYDVWGGVADFSTYNGTADQWRATIVDTNGTSNQVITFAVKWEYLDYRTNAAV